MGGTVNTAAVGGPVLDNETKSTAKAPIFESIQRVAQWLEANDYEAYDTFDGLNSPLLRPLTFESKFLRQVLQQGVRRIPVNIRRLIGIRGSRSSKGMGYIARGYMRLHQATGGAEWTVKAKHALQWLIENQSTGYSGACWGNHFDYQSRNSFVKAGVPSIVWTSLIGHAFLDAYEHFGDAQYLDIAVSACEHILQDLGRHKEGAALCLSYFPTESLQVHNSNTLGASLLGRTYGFTRKGEYLEIAAKAMAYTAGYQRPNHSWYYGEKANVHWVDNFHTAYVLDSFKYYESGTGDTQFHDTMTSGYEYWKNTFFLDDGTPRYYDRKTLPIDIQCCSQAIDTLVLFHERDHSSLELALKVARWTIANMQDSSGYFYYRRYSSWLVNKTPTLHWGQATMLCALAALYKNI